LTDYNNGEFLGNPDEKIVLKGFIKTRTSLDRGWYLKRGQGIIV